MAETVRSLFLKARTLLDEYSDDGVLIPESEVIDMQGKSILLCDMAQKELYEKSRADLTIEEPTTLATINDITQVNYKADQAIVYYIAARLAPFENKELVNFFEEKFEQLKRMAVNKATEIPTADVYEFVEAVRTVVDDVVIWDGF